MNRSVTSICRTVFIAVFTWGLFPAFVALVGTGAGLWASLYSSELKAGLELAYQKGFSAQFSNEALFGAVLIVMFFVLYALQQSARNMQEEDARSALLSETSRLKILVERLETLPPDGFLQQFQSLYKEVAYLPLISLSHDAITAEDLTDAIRSVLAAIANLAHKFDGADDGQKYVANLMICRTNAQLQRLSAGQQAEIEGRLVFCPDLPSPKLDRLIAILDLIPEFSSDFDSENMIAGETPVIALPVPATYRVDLGPEHGNRYTLLPGAPFVAATHQYAAFESMRALLEWCNDKADLTLATRNEIRQFFHNGAGAQVRSFISVPVCMTVAKDAPVSDILGGLPIDVGADSREDCLAVLNIHSQSEKILGASGYGMFVPIVEPFIRVLAVLLVSYGSTMASGPNAGAILNSHTEK